jgi:predicted nucleotidyltransferase
LTPSGALRKEIDKLLVRKMAGDELDLEPKISLINEYLDKEIIHIEEYAKSLQIVKPDPTEKLNAVFEPP